MDPLEPPQPGSAEGEGGRHLFDGPDTHSVLIQTDYRESEAQTDPYSPEYVVRPGSQPELLTLASLSYGKSCLLDHFSMHVVLVIHQIKEHFMMKFHNGVMLFSS